jgi:hypothetical protein
MSLITQHLHITDRDIAERLCRVETMLGTIIRNQEKIMSDIADLEAALTAIDAKVVTVKADVDELLAKLAAIPTPGLTPEQQAAIDAAVAHANGIAASLGAIDATVHPVA